MTKEQEPMKLVKYNCICGRTIKFESDQGIVAPKREWVGLTEEEIAEIHDSFLFQNKWSGWEYEKVIEAKLREKNEH